MTAGIINWLLIEIFISFVKVKKHRHAWGSSSNYNNNVAGVMQDELKVKISSGEAAKFMENVEGVRLSLSNDYREVFHKRRINDQPPSPCRNFVRRDVQTRTKPILEGIEQELFDQFWTHLEKYANAQERLPLALWAKNSKTNRVWPNKWPRRYSGAPSVSRLNFWHWHCAHSFRTALATGSESSIMRHPLFLRRPEGRAVNRFYVSFQSNLKVFPGTRVRSRGDGSLALGPHSVYPSND
ncbi:predicted protein [Histoplasma capsulatum G186AR]|uniref:Uncharacterized protein n=1 Tax=Ajellomyces capsulatus (strain G186AR / H82 / ATCC MYA-2454 / RMSCC 2432) TaxID=447093 RepID=C0NL13_AJECG|nr:uncharacterized protein HCBG_03843 [Histoplasma capsulatum G186AR]EEH08554.1 predicted protein [Histoplasma capsulatum G186AR]